MNKKCDDFIKDYLKLKKSLSEMTVEEREHTLNRIIELEGNMEKARILKNLLGL